MNPVLVEVVKSTRNAVAEMPNQDIHWEEERAFYGRFISYRED